MTPSTLDNKRRSAKLGTLPPGHFTDVFLFHTPHTTENAEATVREINKRHASCRVDVIDLPISDPKDYSAIMGALGRQVRRIVADFQDADHSICVSSGTAEMRAGWFLLRAANVDCESPGPAQVYAGTVAFDDPDGADRRLRESWRDELDRTYRRYSDDPGGELVAYLKALKMFTDQVLRDQAPTDAE